MELTKTELKILFDNIDHQMLPLPSISDEEYEFMYSIADTITLDDYKKMTPEEQKKWWVESDPMSPPQATGCFSKTGEELYEYNFGFEPAHPSILERVY